MPGSPLKRQRLNAAADAKAASRLGLEAQRLEQLRALHEATNLPTLARDQPEPYSPDLIPELMALANLGLTDAEIVAHWGIDEETFEGWKKAHTEFAEAYRRARARAKAWWERSARVAMATRDNKFPAGAWSHIMRAKFPEYDDKRVSVTINTASLVILDLSHSPRERMRDDAKSLQSRDAVQLEGSYTVMTDGESSLSQQAGTLGAATDTGGGGEA